MHKFLLQISIDHLLKVIISITIIFVLIFNKFFAPSLIQMTYLILVLIITTHLSQKYNSNNQLIPKTLYLLFSLFFAGCITIKLPEIGVNLLNNEISLAHWYYFFLSVPTTLIVYIVLSKNLLFSNQELGLCFYSTNRKMANIVHIVIGILVGSLTIYLIDPLALKNVIEKVTPPVFAFALIVHFATTGFSEELIFRGAFYSYLRKNLMIKTNALLLNFFIIALNASFFILCHSFDRFLNVGWILGAILISTYGCITRMKNKSILLPAIVHALVNAALSFN